MPPRALEERADLVLRLSAVIIDGGLLLILLLAVTALPQTGIAEVIALGGTFSIIEGFTSYSPGKAVLRIRIRNTDGTKVTATKLLGRWAIKNSGYVLGCLTFVAKIHPLSFVGPLATLVILGGGLLALGPSGQALHDKAFGTAIFKSSISPKRFCNNCGAALKKSANFCMACGAKRQ